uniref:AP complex mu/sigma subunit domain-containing protein n=1 Tax=Aegilops tauschii subsp. strangulata TaxID=200361 RepID=A0A453NA10_AEGTS
FVLLVNKQGQTRLAQYYEHLSLDERRALEGEIVRKCLARTDQQVLFRGAPELQGRLQALRLSLLPRRRRQR